MRTRIIDGDGHVFEDHAAIAARLPSVYQDRIMHTPAWHDLFPPLDHLHQMPVDRRGMGRGNVALPEWKTFLEDIGLEEAVLYPTFALAYGMIRDRAWDRAIASAYNEWLAETYGQGDTRLHGMAILPMQDPDAAAKELVRAVKELGLLGGMLPAHGLPNHLGSQLYDPVYAAASEVGACLAVHGGVHAGYGLDDMNVYAVIHGLGHPFGQLISFGGIVLNGYFDKYPKLKMAFLEGGVAWVLMALERLTESYETHLPYQGSGAVVLPPGKRIREYLMDLFKYHRVYIGSDGDELFLANVVKEIGEDAVFYSSDFPHEVTTESCLEELEEFQESEALSDSAKRKILWENAARFYGLNGS